MPDGRARAERGGNMSGSAARHGHLHVTSKSRLQNAALNPARSTRTHHPYALPASNLQPMSYRVHAELSIGSPLFRPDGLHSISTLRPLLMRDLFNTSVFSSRPLD